MVTPLSQRTARWGQATGSVMQFILQSEYSRRKDDPNIADFVVGNPHEMPLPAFVDALQRWSVPQNKNWFAYTINERPAQEAVVQTLRQLHGLPFEPDDVCLTTGAFGALSIALTAVTDPGDEVIFNSPPWFFYEGMIAALGDQPVRVRVNPATFDLDLDAIAGAITPRTRAIIVNSPNNPTGRIYPPDTLRALARILTEASERHGRPIYLFSDEAYKRILYDGADFHSPAEYYPNTLMIYTYGKTLLTPGQRVGYIALPPAMPEREAMRLSILSAQMIGGHQFPNALLQHALPDLEKLSIDVEHLQAKRDRLLAGLRAVGYDVHTPEGTFYLLPRSPIPNDLAFIRALAAYDVFCLPGAAVEMPGYFRISMTASDAMIDRGLPGFEKAYRQAAAG